MLEKMKVEANYITFTRKCFFSEDMYYQALHEIFQQPNLSEDIFEKKISCEIFRKTTKKIKIK